MLPSVAATGRSETASVMDYRTLEILRRSHSGCRLLVADHAPLVASFLHDSFTQPNIRAYKRPDLVSRLDDHLYRLREPISLRCAVGVADSHIQWRTVAPTVLRRPSRR